MKNFKIGCVVRCVDDRGLHEWFTLDSIHEVISIEPDYLGIAVYDYTDGPKKEDIIKGNEPNWHKRCFEVIAPKYTKAVEVLYGGTSES